MQRTIDGPYKDNEHWIDEIPERLEGAEILAVPKRPEEPKDSFDDSHIEKIINDSLMDSDLEKLLKKSIQEMKDAADREGREAFDKAAADVEHYASEILATEGGAMPIKEAELLREWLRKMVGSLRKKIK